MPDGGRTWPTEHAPVGGSDAPGRMFPNARVRFIAEGRFSSRRARLRAFWHFIVLRHEYEICMACGRPVGRFYANRSYWTTTDDLWLRVTSDPATIRCSACFSREADDKGLRVRWEAIEGFGGERR